MNNPLDFTGKVALINGDEQAYAAMERAGRPEEIAAAVRWLCIPRANYVVGHALTVDGGGTVE